MTVTVLFTRSLAGAFRLGVQCPPADLIHFTKLTLSVIGTKWAPGSLIPFPIPLLPAQPDGRTITLWGHCTQRAASPSIPGNFIRPESLTTASVPKRSAPRRRAAPSHLRVQTLHRHAGKLRMAPCVLLLWTQSVAIPSLLCAHLPFVWKPLL